MYFRIKILAELMVLFSVFHLIFPQESNALYLDPGSGSLLIQMILAGLVGAAYFLRLYWKKIKTLFGSMSVQNESKSIEHRHED